MFQTFKDQIGFDDALVDLEPAGLTSGGCPGQHIGDFPADGDQHFHQIRALVFQADRENQVVGQQGDPAACQGIDQPLRQYRDQAAVQRLQRQGGTGDIGHRRAVAVCPVDQEIGQYHERHPGGKAGEKGEQHQADHNAGQGSAHPLADAAHGMVGKGDHHKKHGNDEPVNIRQLADPGENQAGGHGDHLPQGKAQPEAAQIRPAQPEMHAPEISCGRCCMKFTEERIIKLFRFPAAQFPLRMTGVIIDHLENQDKMAVPVDLSPGEQAGPVVGVDFPAACQTGIPKLPVQAVHLSGIRPGTVRQAAQIQLAAADGKSLADQVAHRIPGGGEFCRDQDKQHDDQEGDRQGAKPPEKIRSGICRGDLEKDQRHTQREIIDGIIFVNQDIGNPEKRQTVDDDAQSQGLHGEKSQDGYGGKNHVIFYDAPVIPVHAAETEKDQRGKRGDHGVLRAKHEIGQKEDQGRYDGRHNGLFDGRF